MNQRTTQVKDSGGGCFTMYSEAISYANKIVYFNKAKVSGIDLVHDAIAYGNINDENYKKIIKGFFYKEKSHEMLHVKYTSYGSSYISQVKLIPCKYCMRELPDYEFRTITDKHGRSSLLTTACKKCEHIGARDRIKKFTKRETINLGDYYIKKSICRRTKKAFSDISEDDIEIKKTEMLLNRISKSFNYKRYGQYRRKKT